MPKHWYLWWLSCTGESIGAGLSGTLSGARVNGAAQITRAMEWSDAGHTLLVSPCPVNLRIGECPLSDFLCFFLGTGDDAEILMRWTKCWSSVLVMRNGAEDSKQPSGRSSPKLKYLVQSLSDQAPRKLLVLPPLG